MQKQKLQALRAKRGFAPEAHALVAKYRELQSERTHLIIAKSAGSDSVELASVKERMAAAHKRLLEITTSLPGWMEAP